MKFTVFDFETCNGFELLSAVDLAVAVFDDGKLTETRSWRFYPIDDLFRYKNSSINGIYKNQVDGLATFREKWDQIRPYFDNKNLIAHNASFDFKVLNEHLEFYEYDILKCELYCTLKLSRSIYDLDNYKLSTLCEYLNIPLLHHNSVSDAVATGQLLLNMSQKYESLEKMLLIHDHARIIKNEDCSFEDVSENQELFTESHQFDEISSSIPAKEDSLEQAAEKFIKNYKECKNVMLLSDWSFSTTGDVIIDKPVLTGLLNKLGAKVSSEGEFYSTDKNPIGPTNALIISNKSLIDISSGAKPSGKLKRATKLKHGKKAKPIKLFTEEKLYCLINDSLNANIKNLVYDDYREESIIDDQVWPSCCKHFL